MKVAKLSAQYREVQDDVFPESMEIIFRDSVGKATSIHYKKAEWTVEGKKQGLRYGENPDQPAALYVPSGGNLAISGAAIIQPEGKLVSGAELLQSGKHPGKTNLTDVDSALGILRYLMDTPACAVMKHNNPSGVAIAGSIEDACHRAWMADRVAAFGGALVLNRTVSPELAEYIASAYCEVVAAPDFHPKALECFAGKKNLRIMQIPEIEKLARYKAVQNLDFRSLLDGGCIVQASFASRIQNLEDLLPAVAENKGEHFSVKREATQAEKRDMLFGWAVESAITSNSVIYVKNGVTIGIGAGEQDRVGVAILARDKAYRKLEDRLSWERHGIAWNEFTDENAKQSISEEVMAERADLPGSVMISDAFFPFRDGIEVGLKEGVSAVLQPGGAMRDWDIIEACNEYGAAMMFSGQRAFRH